MTIRFANIKGLKFLEEPLGDDNGLLVLLTFDLRGQAYTGGSDTIQLGGEATRTSSPRH